MTRRHYGIRVPKPRPTYTGAARAGAWSDSAFISVIVVILIVLGVILYGLSKTIDEIPEELMIALEQHYWPGNIRELQNVIERGVIMTTGSVLSCRTTDQLVMAAAEMWGPAGIRTLADAERAHIIATLRATKWVIGGAHGAAAHLGLPRTTLLSRMQRLGISGEPAQRWTRKQYRGIVPRWESASTTPADDAETLQAMEAMAG